jgi:hypothetical protein
MPDDIAAPHQPLSPIPRRISRPSWLDFRLITGVGLVILSMLVGATVISRADHRDPMWTVSHDVAAGTLLGKDDVTLARVQLGGRGASYLPASEAIIGRTLRIDLASGELVPRAAVVSPPGGVTVSIPIAGDHAPRITAGDRVTVWLTTKTCRGAVLLGGVPVQSIRNSGGGPLGGSPGMGLVLRLSQQEADRVMAVVDADGAALRVGILSDGEPPPPAANLSACTGAAP